MAASNMELDLLHNTIFERERSEIFKKYHSLSENASQPHVVTMADLADSLKRNHGLDPKSNPELQAILHQLAAKQHVKLQHEKGQNSHHSSPTTVTDADLSSVKIEFEDFLSFMDQDNPNVVQRAFSGKLAVPDWPRFISEIIQIFERVRENKQGANADYIPQLAEVDPELLGISICTVDGQQFHAGDFDFDFTIQSCSKVFTYCMACEDCGVENVHRHVGCEPSGVAFNAFTLDENMKPHNPMINGGAITVSND